MRSTRSRSVRSGLLSLCGVGLLTGACGEAPAPPSAVDVAPVADDDGDEDELDTDVRPDDAPGPPIVVPRLTPSGPETTARARVGGGQRYGEAVVRQVLGATFVREEPYDAPTRFA